MPKIIIYAVMIMTLSISTALSQPAIPVTEEKPIDKVAIESNQFWPTLKLPCNWMSNKPVVVWGRYETPQGMSERVLNIEVVPQSNPQYIAFHVPQETLIQDFHGVVVRYTVNSRVRCSSTFGFDNRLVR